MSFVDNKCLDIIKINVYGISVVCMEYNVILENWHGQQGPRKGQHYKTSKFDKDMSQR